MSLFGRKDNEDTANADDATTVAGERGIASVNRARSMQSRVSSVLAIGLMSALGLGLLTWYYANTFSRRTRVEQSAQAASKSRAQGEMPLPSLGKINAPHLFVSPPEPLPATTPPPASFAAGNISSDTTGPAGGGALPAKTPGQLAFERRLAGPAFASRESATAQGSLEQRSVSSRTAAGTDSSVAASDVGAVPASLQTGHNETSMAALLRPSVTPAVRARLLPTQRFLLPKGAFIDCTLETAIDSTLPGMTTCITATDTFSVDGQVILLERGSKLVGETRGQVQQGSARVFVLWTEARTPTGVVIPLDSPGTDELGRSGLSGQVNRHFFERFGAAILISVIEGAVQRAAQPVNGGSTVIYNPSASQDIMTEVLKSTVNIAPTVTKSNGDRIQVLVARDLDFRSVYELRPVATHRE